LTINLKFLITSYINHIKHLFINKNVSLTFMRNKLNQDVSVHVSSVLRPGPARRVNLGPGRPGPVAGSGLSKKQAGNWRDQTRSTRRVDPGPGRPGQTRLRPGFIFFLYSYARNDVVLAFYN
jgi:hypothetical protein